MESFHHPKISLNSLESLAWDSLMTATGTKGCLLFIR